MAMATTMPMQRPPPPPPPRSLSSSAGRQRDYSCNPPPPPPPPHPSAATGSAPSHHGNYNDIDFSLSNSNNALRASFSSQCAQDHHEYTNETNNCPLSSKIAADLLSVGVLSEDDASQFKRFCSMSLSELESPGKKGKSRRAASGSSAASSLSNSYHDNSSNLNSSSFLAGGEFVPRPVRVSQFDDGNASPRISPRGEVSPVNNTPPRGSSRKSNFVKSVRKLPLEKDKGLETPGSGSMMSQNDTSNSYRRTPSSNNYNGNFDKANPPPPPPPGSAKSPSISAAMATASPTSIASCKTPIDCLPDNVDKKGRCLKHPNVKMFKKKLLGGYEMLLVTCPTCEEEAPYESLWRCVTV